MKISKLIEKLTAIKEKFGDICVTGGFMSDDRPLSNVCVTNKDGYEIYPNNPNGTPEPHEIDGVFFE